MLPSIIVSSVIRSTHRGDSHGGIYRINLETDEVSQLLDWSNPDICWDGRGGDRGIRGMAFWGDTLYAVAGNELFAFRLKDGKLEHTDFYGSKYLRLTHEAWRHKDKLYICSGGTDTIMVFDLVARAWTTSYVHNKETAGTKPFDPLTSDYLSEGGFMHLDSVYANDDSMWYSGAYTDGLWRYDFLTGQTTKLQLQNPDTHNARPHKDGMLYNLSRKSLTVFERGGEVQDAWQTPLPSISELSHTNLPSDHAVLGYTRGMVTYDDYVIVGTSPAAITVFEHGNPNPIHNVQISKDLRNSVCGMVLDEFSCTTSQ
jgi:hypothetical protein